MAAPVAWVPTPTVTYRRHGHGLSNSPAKDILGYLKQVYRKHGALIESLPAHQRTEVLARRHVTYLWLSRMAADENTGEGNRLTALRYWAEALVEQRGLDFKWAKLLLKIVLPNVIYSAAKSVKSFVWAKA